MRRHRKPEDPRREPPAGPPSAAALLGVVLLWAVLAAAQAPPPTSVDIRDSQYSPPVVTVPVGTTVRWTNHDEDTHTVTSMTGLFGSAGLDRDETFTHTFTTPGLYPYGCDLHPFMRGTIVVQ
jgi:plastocyanin